MQKSTIQLIEKLEALLKKEARIPLANRLLSEQTAEVVANSWINQSWSHMLHEALVEEGDRLLYHRVLNRVLKEGLPELTSNLRKNVYAPLILDLVEQEHQELLDHGEMDALYLFEMALELSKIDKGIPLYTQMLNMISFHQNEFGTLEKLRTERHPRMVTKETHMADGDLESLETCQEEQVSEHIVYIEPLTESEDRVHDTVIEQWRAFEKRVSLKVTCILNDSKGMKAIKTNLWQKQQAAEKFLELTQKTCENTQILRSFHRNLEDKRPQFRNSMGKKISAKPATAAKVYSILDLLSERKISAIEYLDIAVALAKADKDTTISMIETDLKNQGDLFINSKEIIKSLERP